MLSRPLLLPTLPLAGIAFLAVIGLAACDGSNYRRSGGQWTHGDARFTPQHQASFEPLEGDFGRDAERGYCARMEIPDSHGPSFENIDASDTACARDRAKGYYGWRDQEHLDATGKPRRVVRTLGGADPAMLRVLGRDYAVDARHVWHQGQVVVGADPATFAVDASYQEAADASDKSGAWSAGRRMVVAK